MTNVALKSRIVNVDKKKCNETNIATNTRKRVAEISKDSPMTPIPTKRSKTNCVDSSKPRPDIPSLMPLSQTKLPLASNGQFPASLRAKLYIRRQFLKNVHKKVLQAAHTGTVEPIKEYLSTSNEAPNLLAQLASTADALGETPLIIASIKGHLDVVRFLVEKVKVDVNQTGIIYIRIDHQQDIRPITGITALHAAVVSSHHHVVSYLAEVGKASVNGRTSDGSTALHLAATYLTGEIQQKIVRCLLIHGADSIIVDREGKECWERASDADFYMQLIRFWLSDDEITNVDSAQSI